MDMEDLLVWTYQDQFAHTVTVTDDLRLVGAGYGNGMRGFEVLADLGCLVDGKPGVANVAGDAEAIHAAVLALDDVACGLVVMHAVAGTRPDWMPGAVPLPVPVRRANGKPELVYHDLARSKPAYCRPRYKPAAEVIELARESYTAWWQGVAGLAVALGLRGLEDHEISGFAAPGTPWLVKNC